MHVLSIFWSDKIGSLPLPCVPTGGPALPTPVSVSQGRRDGTPNQLDLRWVCPCLFLLVSFQGRAKCFQKKQQQNNKNPKQQKNNTNHAHTEKKKTKLKDRSWARTTAKRGFWASPPPFPAMHSHVRAGSQANSDFLGCSKLCSPLSRCQVYLCAPRPGCGSHALLQLLSWSYRLPVCNFSLSCPSATQRGGQEAPARQTLCCLPAAPLPVLSASKQHGKETNKICSPSE